eukprot:CAMPEP_0201282170 /NCGR_PEP_ID=MMETSP1317-20130820/4975_1 /ASSEMBLY_ACC=CAM_ASM_000770 /TAXON_ID=187299 /ORGANISM="Undescribed Undescribed, Strain Undescribed" /LENGTH=65 /DNA_ID=CAMNT_0047594127 /DNA_START=488 /DNA_END=685 /DNA_ORIENTATION=+
MSPEGLYEVQVFEMGIWMKVIVDDYFPVDSRTAKLAFSGPKIEEGVTELWVCLLEKAWAKIYGSY